MYDWFVIIPLKLRAVSFYIFAFGAIPNCTQGLYLGLCLGITPDSTWGTIWGADWTWVSCLQGKCLIPTIISLAPKWVYLDICYVFLIKYTPFSSATVSQSLISIYHLKLSCGKVSKSDSGKRWRESSGMQTYGRQASRWNFATRKVRLSVLDVCCFCSIKRKVTYKYQTSVIMKDIL